MLAAGAPSDFVLLLVVGATQSRRLRGQGMAGSVCSGWMSSRASARAGALFKSCAWAGQCCAGGLKFTWQLEWGTRRTRCVHSEAPRPPESGFPPPHLGAGVRHKLAILPGNNDVRVGLQVKVLLRRAALTSTQEGAGVAAGDRCGSKLQRGRWMCVCARGTGGQGPSKGLHTAS